MHSFNTDAPYALHERDGECGEVILPMQTCTVLRLLMSSRCACNGRCGSTVAGASEGAVSWCTTLLHTDGDMCAFVKVKGPSFRVSVDHRNRLQTLSAVIRGTSCMPDPPTPCHLPLSSCTCPGPSDPTMEQTGLGSTIHTPDSAHTNTLPVHHLDSCMLPKAAKLHLCLPTHERHSHNPKHRSKHETFLFPYIKLSRSTFKTALPQQATSNMRV